MAMIAKLQKEIGGLDGVAGSPPPGGCWEF